MAHSYTGPKNGAGFVDQIKRANLFVNIVGKNGIVRYKRSKMGGQWAVGCPWRRMPTTNPIRDRSTEKTFLIVGLLPSPHPLALDLPAMNEEERYEGREGIGLSRRSSPLTDPRRRKRVLSPERNSEGLDSK